MGGIRHSYVCVVCFDMGDTYFSIYFCTESSIYEAMYIFALSYGVEHIFYCIRVLVEHFTGGIIGNKHPLVYIPCLAGSFLLAYFWFAKGTVYEGKYPIGRFPRLQHPLF